MASGLVYKSDLACGHCRRRKSKCDRVQPRCGSCVRHETPCIFTEERPKRGPKKGQLQALKAQVAILERQLAEQNKTEVTISDSGNGAVPPHDVGDKPSSLPTSADIITGTVSWLDDLAATWDDQLLELPEIHGSGAESPKPTPVAEIPGLSDMAQADLDALYFDRVHPFVPIIHKERYFSWCSQPSPSQVRTSVRLAMWTIAAAMSAQFLNLSESLYGATRQALHALEGNDHDIPWMTGDIQLEEIQAWLLLAHYEFIRMESHHVLLTSARAFRLVQLAQLHAVDAGTMVTGKSSESASPTLSGTEKMSEATNEEKRRTFWAAFCFDRLLNSHDSLSFTLQEEVICLNLPAPEDCFQSLAPFAEVVVLSALYGRCLTHRRLTVAATRDGKRTSVTSSNEFIRRHEWLAAAMEKWIRPTSEAPLAMGDTMEIICHLLSRSAIIHLSDTAANWPWNTVEHQLSFTSYDQRAFGAVMEIFYFPFREFRRSAVTKAESPPRGTLSINQHVLSNLPLNTNITNETSIKLRYPLKMAGPSFASTQDFLTARNSLIDAEQALGYQNTLPNSSIERQAQDVVQRIKKWEVRNHHGVRPDGSGCEAGHHFLQGLDAIENSQLFKIAQNTPKGALLHCHFDCILPPKTILEDARTQERLYVKTDCALTSQGFFACALPQFCVLPEPTDLRDVTNVFSKAYVAGSWMKYSDFLRLFPGGSERAELWLTKKMVIEPEDAYHPRQTVDGIWKEFMQSVMVMRSMMCYETAYCGQFRRILWKFAQDGISYAEIRLALNYNFTIQSDDGKQSYGHQEIIQMLEGIQKDELPRITASGLVFHGVKLIYACNRSASREAMKSCMETCIKMKQQFPDFICGFDLQGQEDTGFPLIYWIEELLDMRARIDHLKLDLPFIFHAGETLDHGGDTDTNLFDAILLGTKRIGHGFSLIKHPLLMKLCKEKNIAVETCPISNEVLGLCPTTKNHHLPILLSNCVPCTVNSDDPGSWGASVLSHDFYQALMASDNFSLLTFRVIAEWSFEFSCMSHDARDQASEDFARRWMKYCEWIVDTYGGKE
ncbi:hypothetical protein CSAL01_10593 [Colletotrichum salicis]|uniref:adenosine deaminase n=1 Tax=Colletotrichum salicis TaxID=1209931 RepID=A0A135UP80_9PEZI|nr:hypothetical protein CSAL01_10593 [Colletotrichum salicis]